MRAISSLLMSAVLLIWGIVIVGTPGSKDPDLAYFMIGLSGFALVIFVKEIRQKK